MDAEGTAVGVLVGVAVCVGVNVGVAVLVAVAVLVGVEVFVGMGVNVPALVGVTVGVGVHNLGSVVGLLAGPPGLGVRIMHAGRPATLLSAALMFIPVAACDRSGRANSATSPSRAIRVV